MQYQGRLYGAGQSRLLGGSSRHVSVWFDREADAQAWVWEVYRRNIKAGRCPMNPDVIKREKPVREAK